ncbi:MAG: gliding motility-associated C-terminal domain-containing protein [Bacteroidota bacterium]
MYQKARNTAASKHVKAFGYCPFLLFTLITLTALSQPEANIWYFGSFGRGLDFSSGTPVAIEGSSMKASVGCASVCDRKGNFLFYTNGGKYSPRSGEGGLWNREHRLMKGSEDFVNGKIGSAGSRQSAIAFLKPESDSIYCLFTIESDGQFPSDSLNRGLRYTEIDMRGDNGLGEVILSGREMVMPANSIMAATLHGNGIDYWLVTKKYNTLIDKYDRYQFFLVTSEGVIPYTEQLDPYPTNHSSAAGFALHFSPDGSMLMQENSGIYFFNKDNAELTPFIHPDELIGEACFSHNSQYVYAIHSLTNRIFQYDLLAPGIPASRKEILGGTWGDNVRVDIEDLQLGPDGKIYGVIQDDVLAPDPKVRIFAIDCPNLKADFVSIKNDLFEFPLETGLKFPSFPSHLFNQTLILERVKGDTISICEGEHTQLTLPDIPAYTIQWADGDPNPTKLVSQAGQYDFTVSSECGTTTRSFLVEVEEVISFSLGPDTAYCQKDSITITANSALSLSQFPFIWSDGSTEEGLTVSQEGTYSLTLENSCGSFTDTVEVQQKNCESCLFFLPTAFSPNGDNLNDRLLMQAACPLLAVEVIIYNRWGEVVFSANDITEAWDGTINGKEAAEGVYVCKVSYTYSPEVEPSTILQERMTKTVMIIR